MVCENVKITDHNAMLSTVYCIVLLQTLNLTLFNKTVKPQILKPKPLS